MKFITEDDLRDLYKRETIIDFELPPQTRLTPGARQFLIDRGVNLDQWQAKKVIQNKVENLKPGKKVDRKLQAIEAKTWVVAHEIIPLDMEVANKIAYLGEYLGDLSKNIEEKQTLSELHIEECTGIKGEDRHRNNGPCFPITKEHLFQAGGKRILLLNSLRADFEVLLEELDEYEEVKGIKECLGQIINYLSQIICSLNGWTSCLRVDRKDAI